MNFLAHLYVSTLDDDFLTGSFIADSVKGRTIELLPVAAKQGVIVHRLLDRFTDSHKAFREGVELIKPNLGRWSGVVADIVFDHFLALKWESFSTLQLSDFANYCYHILLQRIEWVPLQSRRILPRITEDDWLTRYSNLEFLNRVFIGMHHRTSSKSTMPMAVDTLVENYDGLSDCFDRLFPDVISYVKIEIAKLDPIPAIDYSHQIAITKLKS